MFSNLVAMLRDEKGQGLVEYALIIALVSVVAIVALRLIGTNAKKTFSNAAGNLS